MTECFIIPDGEQAAYYRQFGKLNRIEPIQLKDGNWCLPTRVISMLQDTYVSLRADIKRAEKRKDVTKAVLDFAEATKQELSVYPKRVITKGDIHERYFADLESPIIEK